MDFWDITKLLARRWMIVLPMLALSTALGVVAMGQVKPDYVATAAVSLVPPVAGQTKPGEATVDQRNPFIGLGLQAIGNAGIVTVTDVSVADQLKASGMTDSYTVTMAQSSPMITFEVVGHSRAQARQTADELIARFDKSVADIQAEYRVAQADLITSVRLDRGTNIKESTSKIKRALVAVVAAGLLLTVATTVGVDAWLRRRQRKRADAHSLPASAFQASTAVTRGNDGHLSGHYVPAMAKPANGAVNGGLPVAAVSPARSSGPASLGSDPTQPINRRQGAPTSAERAQEQDNTLAIPSDATIVLPRVGSQPVTRPGQRD